MKEFLNDYVRYNVPFPLLGSIAILILLISWLTPPPWQLHSSVTTAVGEIMGIMALWTLHSSIMKGGKGKLKHGNTEVEVTTNKEKGED